MGSVPSRNEKSTDPLTTLLVRYSAGETELIEAILPRVYQELHRIAASYMKREARHHTLQPTALVHEAYLKLIDQRSVQWQNRAHFFGIAAQMMRRILTDHARAKHAAKRGGGLKALPLKEEFIWSENNVNGLIELDEAIAKLAKLNERQAKVLELRHFGGLSIKETSEVLNVSTATVERDWALAKAWLHRELSTFEGTSP